LTCQSFCSVEFRRCVICGWFRRVDSVVFLRSPLSLFLRWCVSFNIISLSLSLSHTYTLSILTFQLQTLNQKS
jgi:hypothetical protein